MDRRFFSVVIALFSVTPAFAEDTGAWALYRMGQGNSLSLGQRIQGVARKGDTLLLTFAESQVAEVKYFWSDAAAVAEKAIQSGDSIDLSACTQEEELFRQSAAPGSAGVGYVSLCEEVSYTLKLSCGGILGTRKAHPLIRVLDQTVSSFDLAQQPIVRNQTFCTRERVPTRWPVGDKLSQ